MKWYERVHDFSVRKHVAEIWARYAGRIYWDLLIMRIIIVFVSIGWISSILFQTSSYGQSEQSQVALADHEARLKSIERGEVFERLMSESKVMERLARQEVLAEEITKKLDDQQKLLYAVVTGLLIFLIKEGIALVGTAVKRGEIKP